MPNTTPTNQGAAFGATLEEARKAWSETAVKFLRKSPSRIAYLGNGLGEAASNVNVPGQPNKVYARDSLNSGEYYIVENKSVQPAVNKPVVLGYVKHEPSIEQVLAFHFAGYEYNPSASSYSGPQAHGGTHEFGGGDEVFIDSRLFTPGLLRPLDTPSMQAYVMPFVHYFREWKRYPGGNTPDLTQYIPSSGSRYVLISVDPFSNRLVVRPGDIFTSGAGAFGDATGGMEAIPAPGATEYPLGAISLSDATSSIEWSNTDDSIFDSRLHITPPWVKILDELDQLWMHVGNNLTLPTTGVATTATEDFVANAWALRGREIDPSAPESGQALTWNGFWWSPSTLAGVGEVNTGVNIGTGFPVFREKSGVNLNFRTLVAGTNITLSSATSTVTVNSTGGGGDVTNASNIGTGIETFREKSASVLNFRTLVAGANVAIASATSTITISSASTSGEANTGSNIGTGLELFREKSATSLVFRTLIGGDNITASSSTSAITISAVNSSQGATNLGTGIGVYKETAANTHQFKTLAATGNTTLASNASVVTISSTDTSNSATNIGVGIGVFHETVGNEHQFKTLVAGTNTTLGSSASTVTLNSSYTDTSNSATNLGTGLGVFKETAGNEHQFKTLVAGTNTTLGSNASTVTLNSSYTDTSNSATNIGLGIGVFHETAGNEHQFKTLVSGTNITISSAASTITIDSTDGEVTDAANLGTGIETFREKSASVLNFRTLVAGANVGISSATSTITVSSTDTSNSATNIGLGIGVFHETAGNEHQFKTLAAGDNITLASNASLITISGTDTSNTGENLGTGIGVFREVSGASLLFKTLAATGNTTLGSTASIITISSTDTSNSATNLGTGIGVFKETAGNEHQFKTLVAGTNVTMGSAASTVTINSSYTDTSNSAINLGTGIEVLKETAGGQHQFRTLVAGANIILASATSTVTISGASTSGQANVGENLGTGIGVYRETTATSLLFKSLIGGNNVTVSSAASTVTIDSTYVDTSNSATNLGLGIGVFKETAGSEHQFKTLAGGDNITLASTASIITISGTDASNTGDNIGTGIGVFKEVSGASLLFKSLVSGTNITISSAANTITIGSTDSDDVIDAANLGTGIEVFREKSASVLNFRTLVAGTNVTVSSATSTVTIDSSYTDTSNSATNIGLGIGVFHETAGSEHQFKSLIAGTNTTLGSNASTITINSSYTDTSNSATNLGLGVAVFKETAGNQHQFKTLAAGANVTLASNASVVTISGASQSGEANTGLNLGTGIEVYREKSGLDLTFRTLIGGTNVTVSSATSTITVDSSYTDTSNSATNIGLGIGVFKETAGNEHQFKTLVAGDNTTLASGASTITISGTDSSNTGDNLGTGIGIFREVSGASLLFKSLIAGANVTIGSDTTGITITGTDSDDVIDAANLGTGLPLFREKSASVLNFRTIVAGNNVTVSSATSTVTINSAYTDTSNSATNIGLGIGVFHETAGNEHQFKTLVAGDNTTLASTASTITFSGTDASNTGENLGTGIGVYRELSGASLLFKSLIGGTNVTIGSAASTVTINSAYTDTSNSAINLGTGIEVLKETAGNQHQFRTFIGGTNVTISSATSTVTINSAYTDTSNSATNLGLGVGVFKETAGGEHQFKTLAGGDNITLASTASLITISGTDASNTGENLGTGIGIFREVSGASLLFKSLVAGTNVTIGSAASTITINSSYTDTSNSAANVGTGIEVFRETTGNEHQFRTLIGGTNITVSSATSAITIDGPAAGDYVDDAANLGTGIEVFREKSASILNFRTIIAGTNVSVSSATSTITISSTDTDTSNSAVNLGTGIGVFKETVGNQHQFKTLAATGNTTLASNASLITVSSTDTSNSATNLGTGIAVFKQTAGNQHEFKTLIGGTNVTIGSAVNDVTINSSYTDTSNSATNLGTGIEVLKETAGNQHQFRTFIGGTNVTISSATSTVTINSAYTDTSNSATNIGLGIGVFHETAGNEHQFKSLIAGGNTTLASNASSITISSTDTSNAAANLGTGIEVFKETTANEHKFRTFVAGTNVTISSATSTITVNSSYTDTSNSAISLGTGIDVFKETAGNQHQFKSLVAGTNVTLGSAASTITVNSSYTDTSNSAANLGTGIEVFKETAGNQHQFKTLVAGTNVTIGSAASTVTINSTGGDFVTDGANVGTGIEVFRENSASVLNFRTLVAGTYSTISSATSTITIDANISGYDFSGEDFSFLAGSGLLWNTDTIDINPGAGLELDTDTIALQTPGTLTVATANDETGSHTHAITTSSAPGATSAILASDESGYLKLERLGIGMWPTLYAIEVLSTARPQLYIEYDESDHWGLLDVQSTGNMRIDCAADLTLTPNGDIHLLPDGANNVEIRAMVSIGDVQFSPSYPLHVRSTTTPQVRIESDGSNYAAFTVATDGHLTVTATGTDADMTLAPADDLFLTPVGGTVTFADSAYSTIDVVIRADAGNYRNLYYATSTTLARWALRTNNTAEGGSDAGSDFEIRRYNDAGSGIANVLTLVRATGYAQFENRVGIGVAPSHPLTIREAGTQVRLEYDATYAANIAVDGAGKVTIDTTGSEGVSIVEGLRVGDTTAPTDNDIRAVADIVAGNRIYIGDVAADPSYPLHILSTTQPQFTIAYSSGVDLHIDVDNTGDVIFDAKGGDFTFKDTDGSSMSVRVTGNAVTNRDIRWLTGTLARWVWRTNNDAESGSNVGSDLMLVGYNDAGASSTVPIKIIRATGQVEFTKDIQLDANLDFVGAQSITTTADDLTIAPAGDLIITPTGNDVKITSTDLLFDSTGNLAVYMDTASGGWNTLEFLRNSVIRWDFSRNNDTESGSDTGSTFYFRAFNDAGDTAKNVFYVVRATGEMTVGYDLQLAADLDFVGSQSIRTTSGDLSLVPQGDLLITPTGGDVQITGELGIGGVTPLYPLHIQSGTLPQVRIAYDGSNYLNISVSAAGIVTLVTAPTAGRIDLSEYAGDNITWDSTNYEFDASGGSADFTEPVTITSTTAQQFQILYDSSNHVSFDATSGGQLTITPTSSLMRIAGTSPTLRLSSGATTADIQEVSGVLRLSPSGAGVTVAKGLRVGDTTVPTDNDIRAVGDFAAGGGIVLGGVGDDLQSAQLVTIKSALVTHGVTTLTATNTYGYMTTVAPLNGGLQIYGLTETTVGLSMAGVAPTAVTTKTTSSLAAVTILAMGVSSDEPTTVGANGNLLVIRNYTGTRFIVDEDGDYYYYGTGYSFDNYIDAQLVRALDISFGGPELVDGKFDEFLEYGRDDLQRLGVVHYNDDGHHFINGARLQRLHNGAIWQNYYNHSTLREQVEQLSERVSLYGQALLDAGIDIPQLEN